MLMEVPECYVGGFFSAGGDQFSPENRHNKSGEPFAIDDLLDFSNADAMIMSDGFFDNAAAGNSTDSSTVTAVDSCNSSVSGGDNNHQHFYSGFADPQLSGELCVPQYDDLAELEWLSNFVEDSFSVEDELKTLHILSGNTVSGAGTKPQTPESSSSSETIPSFAGDTSRNNGPIFHPETPLPGKARSKRTRAAPGDWSTRLLNLITPPPPETTVPAQAQANPVTAAKKRESSKNNNNNDSNNNSEHSSGRKCLHCASEKTPQWRTGPMGPKTLCNACGVRYKSGRLVPEYRPAASPTFVSSRHSNSHRKVMEMRRQKEMQRQQQHHHHHQLVSHHQGSIFGDEFLINHSNGPDYRHMI